MTAKRIIIKTVEQAEKFLTERSVAVHGDGTCTVRMPGCGRCGGSGWGGWFVDGGVCYECNRSGAPQGCNPPRKVRRCVIEHARKVRDGETRARRVARKIAERQAAEAARRAERQAAYEARKAERAAKFKGEFGNSNHVAKIGERIDFSGTVRSIREFTYTGWGYDQSQCIGQVINFVTADGDIVVWFNKGAMFKGSEGDAVKARATVKKHSEYQGVAQTVVQRVKVSEVSDGQGLTNATA